MLEFEIFDIHDILKFDIIVRGAPIRYSGSVSL